MSADLRLNDLMDSSIQEPSASDSSAANPSTASTSTGLSWKLKAVLIGIVACGLIGGIGWAYLVITDPGRPDVDTTGKSMSIVIDDADSDSSIDSEALAEKLANPEVITNYFNTHPPESSNHPLDPTIEVAKKGLEKLRSEIKDYTTVLHKQERINGKLAPKEIIECKIRHNRVASGLNQSPLSAYVKFLAPRKMAGREVIWEKGRNNDKLTVHEYYFGRNIMLDLKPTGMLAMKGNRYPVTEIGLETLILRMIEKATRDTQYGECDVEIDRAVKVNGRGCTLIQISHPIKRDHFEFYMAKIYIDDDLNLPISYAAYSWPEGNGEPPLEETYTFTDLKLNVGLTDADFDTKNPKYDFPK